MNDNEDSRDRKGRFSKGRKGGPGRKPKATRADYLQAMAEACPLEKWAAIVTKAVTDAMEGDATARLWLSRHLLGRPDSVNLLAVLAPPPQSGESGATETAKRASITAEQLRAIRHEVYGIGYEEPVSAAVPVLPELMPKDCQNHRLERNVTPPPATPAEYRRAIHARCRELGVSERERKAYQRAMFGKDSLSDFTDGELASMWAYVAQDSPNFDIPDTRRH